MDERANRQLHGASDPCRQMRTRNALLRDTQAECNGSKKKIIEKAHRANLRTAENHAGLEENELEGKLSQTISHFRFGYI